VLDVDLGGTDPEVLATLRQGVAEHRRVHLDYYSFGRDARTERDVDPFVLHAEDGALYLLGHCHQAGGERRFRVDRIAHASLLDETFTPPGDAGAVAVFEPDGDDPRVTLDLGPEAAWVAETYPVEQSSAGEDGHKQVTLAIAAEPWLARLLLALGPQATVVAAPEGLRDAGGRASARILARYR
jgi:proteasome accessory factor C